MKKKVKKLKGNICCSSGCHKSMGCMYGLGFIGAIVYYLSTATSFWMGVLGVLKALVWPAFLIYELFKFLGM
tara:strand:- start:1461 stop:1676 length:216 start_codon:yes stop_codon:yes gene_type:complete